MLADDRYPAHLAGGYGCKKAKRVGEGWRRFPQRTVYWTKVQYTKVQYKACLNFAIVDIVPAFLGG
jgi:hypothetical protein